MIGTGNNAGLESCAALPEAVVDGDAVGVFDAGVVTVDELDDTAPGPPVGAGPDTGPGVGAGPAAGGVVGAR